MGSERDRARGVEGAGPGPAAVPDGSSGTARARRDWRRLLTGASPREVLSRIVQGDPLGVRGLVSDHLRARALLLDADRVHLRALARCARHAAAYRGRPPIAVWLAARVDAAIDDVLRADALDVENGRVIAAGSRSAHAELARPLGLDAGAMRSACVAFNGRTDAERAAFFALVIEFRGLDETARANGVSASEIGRRARRALTSALGASRIAEEGH